VANKHAADIRDSYLSAPLPQSSSYRCVCVCVCVRSRFMQISTGAVCSNGGSPPEYSRWRGTFVFRIIRTVSEEPSSSVTTFAARNERFFRFVFFEAEGRVFETISAIDRHGARTFETRSWSGQHDRKQRNSVNGSNPSSIAADCGDGNERTGEKMAYVPSTEARPNSGERNKKNDFTRTLFRSPPPPHRTPNSGSRIRHRGRVRI